MPSLAACWPPPSTVQLRISSCGELDATTPQLVWPPIAAPSTVQPAEPAICSAVGTAWRPSMTTFGPQLPERALVIDTAKLLWAVPACRVHGADAVPRTCTRSQSSICSDDGPRTARAPAPGGQLPSVTS